MVTAAAAPSSVHQHHPRAPGNRPARTATTASGQGLSLSRAIRQWDEDLWAVMGRRPPAFNADANGFQQFRSGGASRRAPAVI
ncbi:unnamed protein product [Lota lota]